MDTADNGAVSYVVTNPRLQEELKQFGTRNLTTKLPVGPSMKNSLKDYSKPLWASYMIQF
jgi:hypothetical protein